MMTFPCLYVEAYWWGFTTHRLKKQHFSAHWGLNEMMDILKTMISIKFYWNMFLYLFEFHWYIDGLLQDHSNSIANTLELLGRLICPEGRVSSLNKFNPIQTLELLQSCTKSSICTWSSNWCWVNVDRCYGSVITGNKTLPGLCWPYTSPALRGQSTSHSHIVLTHCGLITSYAIQGIGQHWLR